MLEIAPQSTHSHIHEHNSVSKHETALFVGIRADYMLKGTLSHTTCTMGGLGR